jgi:homocysteine S-methyltransferase
VVQSLAAALAERPVILDGGLASELERRGHDLSSRLWSAALLIDDPAAILDVHRAFFTAGAEVATTASYQASAQGFAFRGSDPSPGADLDVAMLLRRSVELAVEARDQHGSGWVAASVGPYGAVLADGSEYRGDYGLTVSQLRAFHRPRLAVLAEAGADVLALETIPCLAEVEALVAELQVLQVPAWLSVTVAGQRTRAGEPLDEVFALAAECSSIVATGVNCLDPADVPAAVRIAVEYSGKPVVAYPNSGEGWDAATRQWIGPSGFEPAAVAGWIDSGARLVGGCCRVTPTDIAGLRSAAGEPGAVRSGHGPGA